MNQYGYPFEAIRGDYFRAGLGLAVVSIPLFMGDVPTAVFYIFGTLVALFATYGAFTFSRHRTRIALDEEGLIVHGWRSVRIPWNDLQEMRLKYFATRRERTRKTGTGWFQLRLKGPDGTVKIESTCDGFRPILERATSAAMDNRLEMGGITITNLEALDVPLTMPKAPRKYTPSRRGASDAEPPS